MANAQRANKILIDTAGSVKATGPVKVIYAMFTPSTANDSVVLRETSSDADIVVLQGATAKNTMHFRFEACPLIFGNGIYVQSISSGAKLLLVTTTGGNN